MRVIDVKKTADNIDGLIKDKYSVRDMASLMDVTVNAIYKWINGTSLPSLDKLVELSGYLNCSINQLIVTKEI